jgi:hypothetical protein
MARGPEQARVRVARLSELLVNEAHRPVAGSRERTAGPVSLSAS